MSKKINKSKSRVLKTRKGKLKEKIEKTNNLTSINISNKNLENSKNENSIQVFKGTKSIIKEVNEEIEKESIDLNKNFNNQIMIII